MKIFLKHIILFFVLLNIITACHTRDNQQQVKLRGKIVNPKTDDVILSRDFLLLRSDTLKLFGENQVKGTVNTPVEGLYVFYVFPEFQTLYLKPGDSLAFHLNVDEFDESLSFSGSLGFENNLLMELFLVNEKESDYFFHHKFDFSPALFFKKIDSFDRIKNQLINDYADDFRHTTSKYQDIVKLLNQSMTMNIKEVYARKRKDVKLPDNYFSYCKILQKKLPDPNVIYLYAFANSFLARKVSGQNLDKKHLYKKIANVINNNFYDRAFKNNVLVNYCNRYIRNQHITKADTVIFTFYQYMDNKSYKDYCKRLIHINRRLKQGKKFPSLILTDQNKQPVLLDTILKNNKVLIGFWDLKQRKNFISNLKKYKKYKSLYPEIKFLIINDNPQQFDEWVMQIPAEKNLMFLQLKANDSSKIILPHHLSQVYLVDNKVIKQSMLNIYRQDFEKRITGFYNEK